MYIVGLKKRDAAEEDSTMTLSLKRLSSLCNVKSEGKVCGQLSSPLRLRPVTSQIKSAQKAF
jgi:hypothetical protein